MNFTKEEKNQIVSDSVLNNILSEIREGKLKPGDKLEGQRKLAKKYSVGMSSIREALSALSILNIVETIHGKGVFISDLKHGSLLYPLKIKLPISKKEVLDFYRIRKYLDLGAVEEIIVNASDKDIRKIEKVMKKMNSLISDVKKGKNIEAYVSADIELHHTIYRLTGNEVLISIVEFLNNNLIGNLGVFFGNIDSSVKSHKVHLKLVEMIKKRDIEKARYYSNIVVDSTITTLSKILKD